MTTEIVPEKTNLLREEDKSSLNHSAVWSTETLSALAVTTKLPDDGRARNGEF